MRRYVWAASLITALSLTAVFLLRPRTSDAEIIPLVQAEAPEAKPAAPHLPITQVTLYSSGVGYFQREGEVEGDARIDLSFPVGDVNDLLKSMVLQDLNGGTISAASYDSHDPLDKTLNSFAVNLTGNPSFADLLHQARGEKVEVTLHQSATPLSGTVIGVEPGFKDLMTGNGRWQAVPAPVAPVSAACRAAVVSYYQPVTSRSYQPVAKDPLETLADTPARLTLWSTEGLRSVALTDIQRVRFVNPAMEREFARALEVLAGAHDNQKRAVSLTFRGQGKRKVRVGYVIESPLWRTSYRLLVKKDGKLFLQGWAVVENPTTEDWKDVRLALVSGRPISFKMDLYQPLYLPRPTVQPQLVTGLQPTIHGEPLAKPLPTGGMVGATIGATPYQQPMQGYNQFNNGDRGAVPPAALPMAPACAPSPPPAYGQGPRFEQPLSQGAGVSLQNGVVASATGAELGDFFEYVIQHPVSLPRQKSAMLPIVNKPVEGARISIYNEGTHAKFPLLALRMKNTSGVHLTQGPVAVFESTGYAGDAHLLDLRPDEDRFVSYAVDLGTEVEPIAANVAPTLTTIRIEKGLLYATAKAREGRTYNVKNRSTHDRTVVIEYPYRAGYRLAGKTKPKERTRDVYRFEVKVTGGKSAGLEVVEERDLVEQVSLCGCEEQVLHHLLKGVTTSDEIKQTIEKALDLKAKLSALQHELGQRTGQLQEIAKDQERLRANLKEMPQSAAAYRRYLEKFDRQETEIERLQKEVREWQAMATRQAQAYEAYWGKVNVAPTPAQAQPGTPLFPCPATAVRCGTNPVVPTLPPVNCP